MRRCRAGGSARLAVLLLAVFAAAAAAEPAQREQRRVNPKDGQVYIWIEPGSFSMGCSPGDAECHPEEKPAHTVRINGGFWIGQTVATVDAWKRYRAAGRYARVAARPEPGTGEMIGLT